MAVYQKQTVKMLCCRSSHFFGYNTRPNPGNSAILKLPTLSFPRHDPVYEQLGDLLGSTWTPYFQWRELIMGLSWIFLLLVMKHIGNLHRCLLPPFQCRKRDIQFIEARA